MAGCNVINYIYNIWTSVYLPIIFWFGYMMTMYQLYILTYIWRERGRYRDVSPEKLMETNLQLCEGIWCRKRGLNRGLPRYNTGVCFHSLP